MRGKFLISQSPRFRTLADGLPNCPIFSRTVGSLIDSVQAPADLAIHSLLGAISTVAQANIDVENLYDGKGPTSLFLCGVADSGERKTALSAKVFKPIIEFERNEAKEQEQKFVSHQARVEIHNERLRLLKRKLRKALKEENHERVCQIEDSLIELVNLAPQPPTKTQLIFENSTPESIQLELQRNNRNASLVSNEGATVLAGPISRGLPFLNSQWSGEPFTVNRKTAASFVLDNTRLTLSIMIQPSAIDTFLKNKGEEASGIGFLGRFIYCHPQTTQGTRFIENFQADTSAGLDCFYKRMDELIDDFREHSVNPGLTRHVVEFSPEAKQHARNLYNEIEGELQCNGRFQFAKDHGNKLFENIRRIAALLSYFEFGENEKISLHTLYDAERIAFHFSDAYLTTFQTYPKAIKDSLALQAYCQSKRENGERYITKSSIRRSGPRCLRDNEALAVAIETLCSHGEFKVFKIEATGLVYLDLNPYHYFQPELWNHFCRKYKLSASNQSGPWFTNY